MQYLFYFLFVILYIEYRRLYLQGALGTLFNISIEDIQRIQKISVASQISACGGLKLLTALLTSPTAAINLATSRSYITSNNSSIGSNNVSIGSNISGATTVPLQVPDAAVRRNQGTTSNIQGICNRQASRALIALLYPRMAVPLAVIHGSHTSPVDAPSPLSTTTVTPAHITATATTTAATTTTTTPHPTINNNTTATNNTSATIVPEHLRSPIIGPLFLEDPHPRPWQFTYFYKSGAVKDQFTAYLLFRNHSSVGMQLCGRGVDNIGMFKLHGHAEADITGWSWYIYKSYIPNATEMDEYMGDEEDGSGGIDREGTNSAVHMGVKTSRLERWLQSVEDDFNVHNRDSNSNSIRSPTIHVSHIAYWSSGVEVASCTQTYGVYQSDIHKSKLQKCPTTTAHTTTSTTNTTSTTTAATSNVEKELDFIDEESSGIW